MLSLFELFREAGERLPKAVGQTVAVVGGIVVGDAAIRAGLASTTFLVIASVTAVASFTLVNQSLVGTVTIIRLLVLLCSASFGMYGFILSTIAIVLYLSTLESFGVPFLAPLAPLNWKDLPSALFRKPWYRKKRRPDMLDTLDSTRQKEGE
nr:spore germination protein [Cohnella sp. YIM B05605]